MENNIEKDQKYEENCVYIGNKDNSLYISHALRVLMNNENKEIIIMARGAQIPHAISIAMSLRANYIKDVNFHTIIGSELLENKYVPYIEIHLSKFAYAV